MISFFQFFAKKLRLSNPWRYKVPLLFSFTYFLLLVGNVRSIDAAIAFFASVATTVGFMGFGYLTNDLADRRKDALAGKSNSVGSLSSLQIVLLFGLFLSLAIAPWFYLPFDNYSILLIVAEFTLFTIYAFPPFRLKEKGIFGVAADALYAHVVPAVLASWTYYLIGNKAYDGFFLLLLSVAVWQFFSGMRNIFSHQLKDLENDLASGTKTFATALGARRSQRWMKRVFIPLEVMAVLPFLVILQIEIEPFFIGIAVFLVSALANWKNDTSNESAEKKVTNAFLDQFYIHWLPYLILAVLAFGKTHFWWLPMLHFVLFHPMIGKVAQRFRKRKSDSIVMDEAHQTSRKVAILTTNRKKYSETFIHTHIENLTDVVVYADGYFPEVVSFDRGITWQKYGEGDRKEEQLIASWKANGIEVVLAEYGPAGVEVMNACRKANLPLVVHFHGFDAYRNDVLTHYGDRYKELFEYASAVVVVSKDMAKQLQSLGCPASKLHLIHYGVDTEFFAPNPSMEYRLNFIACGRFVGKKGPLHTIRAFKRVVNRFPDAQLTFIGDGELLDAAKSLTTELNLEKHVVFKGVLSPEEVAEELQKHAVFVQHSMRTEENDSEGTPLVILEAASTGLAIVSTRHGGIVDVVEEGESGFLVEEGAIEAMGDRMIELLENPDMAHEMGIRGRARIQEVFSQTKYIQSFESLVNTVEVVVEKQIHNKWTIWKYRMVIFFGLFILAEIMLRFVGFKPGVIEEFYYHDQPPVYDSLMYGDEVGISHIVPGSNIIENGIINQEGFFSSVEFTPESMKKLRASGKKIVMLIGDSYTQGCCADKYEQSFASLVNQSEEYEVLNFGIPGADPLQYRLIVDKYAPLIQPDLIVVAVYGGNDIMEYDRTPKPFIPLAYPIKNGPWLNSEGPIYLTEQGTYFENFEAAKTHYYTYFSLWDDQSSFFEKLIRPSILLSRPYMKWKTKKRFNEIQQQMPKTHNKPPYSEKHLAHIKSTASQQKSKVLFTLIPSPGDVDRKENLTKKYGFLFGEISWKKPPTLVIEDYDGSTDGNHFNAAGHKKYAHFLTQEIMNQLKK